MATTKAAWGIDMGRCALKAVKVRLAGENKVEIVAADYIEHEKILTQPDADRQGLIAAALEKFLSRNDVSKDLVVVGVPGQHTLARFTKLPPVAPKRIPDIVRYEADQQIPFDMDEVIWDYQTFQQEGLPDIEVGIFAMKRELIREHLLHFEQATIEPIAVQSGPLAIYNAAVHDGLVGNETTILLDIGAENTDLVIATPNSLWTRTVPIGGNAFTDALVKAFKLSFSKAEGHKRTAATNKYAKQMFTAMRPTFADLVQELQRSIGFYSSTHRDASVERVVGVGNAFLLPGLQRYLQQNLGLPVENPATFKNAAVSLTGGEDVFKEQFLSYFAAYGLALQGLDVTKVTSNLLPAEIAKQSVWRKKRPAFAAAAAFLVLSGGLIWFRQAVDMRALAASASASPPANMTLEQAARVIESGPSSSDSDRLKAMVVLKAGETLKKELGNISQQGKGEREEAEALIALQRNKALVSRMLEVIHRSVPRGESALAEATTPAKLAEAVASGAVKPRNQRKVVTLEALLSQYETNLHDYDWKPLIEMPKSVNPYGQGGGGELPGMMFKLTVRTPNKDGAVFVRDEFVKKLLAEGRKLGLGFYFDNASLIKGAKLEAVRAATVSQPTTVRPGATRPGAPAPAQQNALSLDPVTNEPSDEDWEFEIWVSAILGDYPGGGEEETGAGETAPDESDGE